MPPKRTQDKVRFNLKVPGKGGRASFAIIKDQRVHGRRRTETVEDSRISAINRTFRNGAQDLTTCLIQAREVIADLYKQHQRRFPTTVHNEENLKLFEQYWKYRYEDSGIERPEVAEDEILAALDVVGSLSLYSASKEALQKRIDSQTTGNKQRRTVQRVTALLKFAGRHDIRLRKHPKVKNRVKYVTERDLPRLLRKLPDEPLLKALVQVCFHSGLRPGEAYALTEDSLVADDQLRVVEQLHFSNKYLKDTKNRVQRIAYLLPGGLEAFRTWVSATPEEMKRMKQLRSELARIIGKACRDAFPGEPLKHLAFKDLRHCYAIQMVKRGVSLSLVAQSLGNTLSVCQAYYAGYVLTTDSIEAIRAIVSRAAS